MIKNNMLVANNLSINKQFFPPHHGASKI